MHAAMYKRKKNCLFFLKRSLVCKDHIYYLIWHSVPPHYLRVLLFQSKLTDIFLDASHHPTFKLFNFLFQIFCFMILNISNSSIENVSLRS